MRVIYIAHPLGAGPDREENRRRATLWVAWAAEQGVGPVATWITLSGLWPETPENRSRGLRIDLATIERCDEVWLVGGLVSPGMAIEAEHARELGTPVVDLTHLGKWPPGTIQPSDVLRCEHCGWPIVVPPALGCWPTNCMQRPMPPWREDIAAANATRRAPRRLPPPHPCGVAGDGEGEEGTAACRSCPSSAVGLAPVRDLRRGGVAHSASLAGGAERTQAAQIRGTEDHDDR